MLDENVLWQAVEARNPAWDGLFVYAVSSTGIYCRPTCPSRRPRRERVQYFQDPATAGRAGFRACRRCRPDAPLAAAPGLDRVVRACRAIAKRPASRVSLPALARVAGIGPHQLLRSFRTALGVTPREYAEACRTGCLKTALRTGSGVADAVYAAGFGSGSRVYERSASTLGMTPGRYAALGEGTQVTYAVGGSSLGHVLVARTSRGICSVSIGSDPAGLLADLRREFPAAAVNGEDRELARALEQVVAAIEGSAPDPRLPLDLRATAFQQRVWRELQRIPRGTTRSYQEIAERIGRPAAARAVARACASNPVAVLVPCHRVVRADGSPGGYRWGGARKERLLEAERHRRGD
ncbi:MAG TPA: bifunctional DNA-binding transcriptional regulator/O6-methylguanine-DNA methyltransferase Ada [Vicinamibacterales bacterium]|nr:bifunctional DNA-binding transcriptional regulator/O6-methylguanine-DNA methyltransferase Ada [Vicinamibacterales bacterium]